MGRRVRQVFKKNCEICAGFLFRPPFGLLFSRFAPHLPPTHPTRRAEAVSAVYEFHKLRAAKVKGGNGSITAILLAEIDALSGAEVLKKDL